MARAASSDLSKSERTLVAKWITDRKGRYIETAEARLSDTLLLASVRATTLRRLQETIRVIVTSEKSRQSVTFKLVHFESQLLALESYLSEIDSTPTPGDWEIYGAAKLSAVVADEFLKLCVAIHGDVSDDNRVVILDAAHAALAAEEESSKRLNTLSNKELTGGIFNELQRLGI